MTDRELFKMALEALELVDGYVMGKHEAKEALRARLAEDEIHDGWYKVDAWVKEKP